VNGVTGISYLDPYFLNNIQKAKLKSLFSRACKLERDHTTSFVGFPLVIVVMLNNQNIAIVTRKIWGTVTIAIEWLRSVKQAGVSIGHVTTGTVSKFAGRNLKSQLFPLQRNVGTWCQIFVIKRNIKVITFARRSRAWHC